MRHFLFLCPEPCSRCLQRPFRGQECLPPKKNAPKTNSWLRLYTICSYNNNGGNKCMLTKSITSVTKGAITSKIKHAIKHTIKLKTSPARLAQLLPPSLAFCFSLQPMTAYVVQRHDDWLLAERNAGGKQNQKLKCSSASRTEELASVGCISHGGLRISNC